MAEPLPPEQAPAQEGGSGEDQMAQLVKTVSDGLAMLAEISSQASPETSQALQQLNDQYMQIVSGAGMAPGGPAPQGQGMATPEQGASGAIPAGPAR